jgi:hypothetical protein
LVTPPVDVITTTIATWGWSWSTSIRRIVVVAIGGAETIASMSVTWESCSVVARIASSTSRRMTLSRSRAGGSGSNPSSRISSTK